MRGWLVRFVARLPLTVHAKLLAAFLVIVVLLIVVGVVGLEALATVNRRADDMSKLQRKIAAYRQLQHDTTAQLYTVASALAAPDERTLEVTLRQVNQFGYDLDRLQFVARDEVELIGRVRDDYEQFIKVVTRAIDLLRSGRAAEGREVQVAQAGPLAERLERLTNELVNKAEADMVAGIDASQAAHRTARWIVVGVAVGTICLALALGYVISWSLIAPVKEMDDRLRQIAAGDFSRHVAVPNRDELGTLAGNLNRMSDELGRLYRDLEAASRHKSQFLANMSHELRTPMNAILGYTELMADGIYGGVPEPMRDVLTRVDASGRHLLGLINDVLDLSKIEAGQLTLTVAEYSMKEVVETVVASVESLTADKRLRLVVDLAPELPTGYGDQRRLAQVLLNLVGNAIKFTDHGQIAIRIGAASGLFAVAVSDTGPGIAAADQERIFEEFQQADTSTTRPKGGTGLGLAIARRIVAMHGGRIWVESAPGEGAIFRFTIPVRSEQPAPVR